MTGPQDGDFFDRGREGREGRPAHPRIPGPRPAADDLAPSAAPRRESARDPAPKPDLNPDMSPATAEDREIPAEEPETAEEPEIPTEPAIPTEEPAIPAENEIPAEKLTHKVLTSLLGAWALAACSAEETALVEEHLTECAPCAEEALRLRDAVGLLHADRSLDLDPLLRSRVLESCLGRRPARIPVPDWAAPYDAETARLDALLRDFGDAEWHAPVRLSWFEEDRPVSRRTTVAGVIGHLMTVDGLVVGSLGLDDPLGPDAPDDPTDRTELSWRTATSPPTRAVHEPWREQSHTLIRTVSFAGPGVAELSVSYGDFFALPLRDALLDRAFECWVHGADIAEAVSYPYEPPAGAHLHRMIDLAARVLPSALATRRRNGLAGPVRDLVAAGAPGRSLRLEVEGAGGGTWYIALDSPAALGSPERSVGQIALDAVEFCQLVAGHVSPEEAAAGQEGDREAIRDVLFAAASMSRL
ncbi:MDMPI N domain containing protein [Streptomyces sp. SID4917]|uniref:maleylpyruvate isomerase N-terminal domain-containing protein n=1 Tax=Streptomyces sp. MnatMP-M17 TaxID=1839780 RepID=UPI00081D8411|nr:MDMPI N domain containing protein [Streptomyces sp. SID4917]SCG00099.1 Putative zinc-finger [Streptomyces sp. MnatMP-M17]